MVHIVRIHTISFSLQFDGDNKSATGSTNVKFDMQIHQISMPVRTYVRNAVCMPTAADTEKMGNYEVTNNTLQYTNSVLNKKKFFKKKKKK